MARIPVTLTVNGIEQAEFIESGTVLADFLRDKLSLSATKVGCQQGTCGACTVEIDGELALSCLVPTQRAEGLLRVGWGRDRRAPAPRRSRRCRRHRCPAGNRPSSLRG